MMAAPNTPGSATYNSQVPQQSSTDRLAFIKAVLATGGWPDTESNEQFLLNWAQREHAVSDTKDASAAFNILNTGMSAPGATAFNSIVKNYPDFDTGVQATVRTIKQGLFKNVQAGLASGDANGWDAQGRFAQDLHAWSAGPNAPMSKGYTTVSGENGGNGPLNGRGQSVESTTGDTTGAEGSDTNGDIDGFLQSQAPALAAAMNDPEVKTLLSKWGSGQLSDQKFQNQLEATKWWKNTPISQRTLLATQATDPATAEQNLANQMASVDQLAWSKGIKLTPQLEYGIALDSIKNQWSNQQVLDQIVAKNQTTYSAGGKFGGEAASDVEQIKSLYSQYALPVDDQTLNGLVQKVLSGKSTVQDLEQGVAQQAATFYSANPQLADFLKSGQGSAQQWASPLISQVSNIMGINPSTIDLTNSQWSWLLKPQTNPQTGQSIGQAQTLDSVEQKVKTDPVFGYTRTANGINETQQLKDKLQAAFTGGGVS